MNRLPPDITRPIPITEHLSRDIAILRTRGSNIHSIQDRLHHINFPTEHPHRHDFYQLFWVQRGVGRCQVDFVERQLQDHTLHFVMPGHVHSYQFEPACEGLVIVLSEQFFLTNAENRHWLRSLELFFNHLYFQPITVAAENAAILDALARQMLWENERQTAYQSGIIQAQINLFLLYAIREITDHHHLAVVDGPRSRQNQLVLNFFNAVEEHFHHWHRVSNYATHLAITPNYLNEVVKEETAHTAGAIIAGRLVLEAKRLAYFSDLAIQEIATHLGFDDPAYFSRFFKQQSGQTLSQFRSTIRKKYNFSHS